MQTVQFLRYFHYILCPLVRPSKWVVSYVGRVLNTPSSFVSKATTGHNFTVWAKAQRDLAFVLEQVEGRLTEVIGRVLSLRFDGNRSLAGLHLFATVILRTKRIC